MIKSSPKINFWIPLKIEIERNSIRSDKKVIYKALAWKGNPALSGNLNFFYQAKNSIKYSVIERGEVT